MHPDLENYLNRNFGLGITIRHMPEFSAMLVNGPHLTPSKVLILDPGISEKDKTYLGVHSAVHILLGHIEEPFATVFEPSDETFEMTYKELNAHRRAEILTRGIIDKKVDEYWDVIWEATSHGDITDPSAVEDIRQEALQLSKMV